MSTGPYNGTSNTFTVSPSTLNYITISPLQASITAGNSKTYTATAYDQYGNYLGVVAATYSVNGSSVNSNSVYETAAGTYVVTATYQSLTSTSTLTVTAGTLDHITISPTYANITSGISQTYTAEGWDLYGNSLGSINASFSINNSTISGNSVNETVAGIYTVTATYPGVANVSTSLTVNHAAAINITISPDSSTITAGNTQTYTAIANDTYGNTWNITSSTSWSISLNAGGSWSNNTYTSENAGTWTITGTYDSKTCTATLSVNQATLTAIEPAINATYSIGISGNVTAQQISNMTITASQGNETTVITFTITGSSGTNGFINITLPQTAIPYGTTPVVYIDGQKAQNQGYSQDNGNFYVWYTTHFSTHEVSIIFTTPASQQTMAYVEAGLIVAILILIILAIALYKVLKNRKNKNTKLALKIVQVQKQANPENQKVANNISKRYEENEQQDTPSPSGSTGDERATPSTVGKRVTPSPSGSTVGKRATPSPQRPNAKRPKKRKETEKNSNSVNTDKESSN